MYSPLVTVFIPCYNHAQYIEEAINSVINQTYNDIELIVIDDGSTDNSVEVIQKLASKYSFKFIAQKNIGLNKTLNRALKLATGKYWVMLGSDDVMVEDRIEKQAKFLIENPQFSVCASSYICIDSNGNEIFTKKISFREIDFRYVFLVQKPSMCSATYLYDIEVIKSIGGYDERFKTEDIQIIFAITYGGHRIAVIEAVTMKYRVHANNTTKNIRYMFKDIKNLYDLYKTHPLYPRAMRRHLRKTFRFCFKYKEYSLAKEIFGLMGWRDYIDRRSWRHFIRLFLYK